MSIDAITGKIDLGDCGLMIRPDTSRDEFLASPAGAASRLEVENQQYATYAITFKIDTSPFGLSLAFESQRLHSVRLEKMSPGGNWGSWSKAEEIERKTEHDRLLLTLLGSPPYKFEWGAISSNDDNLSGSAFINIIYHKR